MMFYRIFRYHFKNESFMKTAMKLRWVLNIHVCVFQSKFHEWWVLELGIWSCKHACCGRQHRAWHFNTSGHDRLRVWGHSVSHWGNNFLFSVNLSLFMFIKSSMSGDASWYQRSWSSLIQVMAWHLFGAKPSPKSVMTDCWLKQGKKSSWSLQDLMKAP